MLLSELVVKIRGDIRKQNSTATERHRAVRMLELLSRLDIGGREAAVAIIDPFLQDLYEKNKYVVKNAEKAARGSDLAKMGTTQNVASVRDSILVPFFVFLLNAINQIAPQTENPLSSILLAPVVLLSDLGIVSYEVMSAKAKIPLSTALQNSLYDGDKSHRILLNSFKTTTGVLGLFVGSSLAIAPALIGLYAAFSLYMLYKNSQSVKNIDADIIYLEEIIKTLERNPSPIEILLREIENIEIERQKPRQNPISERLSKACDKEIEEIQVKIALLKQATGQEAFYVRAGDLGVLKNELTKMKTEDRPLIKQKAVMNSLLTFAVLAGIILLAIPPAAPVGALVVTVALALQVTVLLSAKLKERTVKSQFPSARDKWFKSPQYDMEKGHFKQGASYVPESSTLGAK